MKQFNNNQITLTRETCQTHNGHGPSSMTVVVLKHGDNEFAFQRSSFGTLMYAVDRSKSTGGFGSHWQYTNRWVKVNKRGIVAKGQGFCAMSDAEAEAALDAYRCMTLLLD